MGVFTGKVLADGQLAATKGTLYTVPGATTTYAKFISLTNTNALSQTIKIYLNPSGTSRQIGPTIVLAQGASELFEMPFTLETGDLIEGESTNAASVDFVITGVNEA